jgi:hypothetical protein
VRDPSSAALLTLAAATAADAEDQPERCASRMQAYAMMLTTAEASKLIHKFCLNASEPIGHKLAARSSSISSGKPLGCGTPKLAAAPPSSPASNMPTSAAVRKLKAQAETKPNAALKRKHSCMSEREGSIPSIASAAYVSNQ